MLLASLMIPDMLMVLPLYSAYVKVGLINTHFPLIIPPIVANTFGTFLLRQFFLSIPKEYDEAALVDGASHFRIFVSVILPLSKPALATLAVLTFVNVWNDFFGPLIYLSDVNKFTIPVGLAFFQTRTAPSTVRSWPGPRWLSSPPSPSSSWPRSTSPEASR